MITGFAFTTPFLLWALITLPLLWWLLRAVPPAPVKRYFPGVVLLLGLRDEDSQADTTPWWLIALRMLALAAAIIGLAGPVLNPNTETRGSGNLLIVMDASWASARDWPARMARLEELLREAERDGRPVAVQRLTDDLSAPDYSAAGTWLTRLPGLTPAPYRADDVEVARWAADLEQPDELIWFSDGLAHASALPITPDLVIQSPSPVYGLTPARFEDGAVVIEALRGAPVLPDVQLSLRGIGTGPNGAPAVLANEPLRFEAGGEEVELRLELLPELRNRITRFEIAGQRSAGAVALTDDALQRREVGLLRAGADTETQSLLDPLFYLRQALAPTADLLEADLNDMLLANPDVLVLADVAQLSGTERDAIIAWVEKGGLLLRFAGPRLAASDEARTEEDPLLPVRLRAGGRSVGGALSWGEPKTLRPFADTSPFAGLSLPEEVTVTSQVMAQPDPQLPERTIAALADGTPLVTRSRLGQGQVVLFHVTANAEWSSLPLSGLFVQMLERLAVSTRPAQLSADDLAGTIWTPRAVLDGFGGLADATTLAGVAGEDLAEARPNPALLPGLYDREDQSVSLNVLRPDDTLTLASWPATIPVEGLAVATETPLAQIFLTLALVALSLDIIAALALGGRLRAAAFLGAVLLLSTPPHPLQAQSLPDDLQAATEITLGYVITGDARVDRVSEAGLRGISEILTLRTSIEPGPPLGVNLETDDISLLPLLYWPVVATQPSPSSEAYDKLNRYMRSGGMIVFDSRDADLGGLGQTPNGRKLQSLAAGLDIPPLEVVPFDHVLTRTFYLLQDFPGRYLSREIWVEASSQTEEVEGLPFRNLNDGVTPIIIGGNDWASAWALDESGRPLFPVGSGFSGERQREIAYRFGVNLVMHVLSGNYKSDQVHVPALLDRLGQ